MKSKILILICALVALSFAKDENPLQEAMEIIKESKTLYSLKYLDKPIPVPDRSRLINYPVYREKKGDSYDVKAIKATGEAKKLLDKAENYFGSHQYAKARDAYTLALQEDPKLYSAITYIGQTYGIEKNWDKAELWYKKAIEANYVDFLAHWLLADVYKIKGQKEKALDEISIAKVLNRNNPRLEALRKEIYGLNGLNIKNWTFNPQVRMSRDSVTGNVNIVADSIWSYYAFVQAAWFYEPVYKAKAKKYSMPQAMYRECLMGFLPFIGDKALVDSVDVLKRLVKVIEADKLDEFVFYDMLLLDYPTASFQLDKKQIEGLKDYLIWANQK
ncbi:tetratricopeptide repeat protein [Fibrobacter sp.]|jgi:tetratricopeptide (TPR) repeat protein|uniref:tetratricopeptide repeat protein n=1 Tax=Fibrobacter sp. TaxID=35828 RepID=UPI00386F205D